MIVPPLPTVYINFFFFFSTQVMQFGRIDGNAYILDFQYPFSAVQAFAVALANVTQRLKWYVPSLLTLSYIWDFNAICWRGTVVSFEINKLWFWRED